MSHHHETAHPGIERLSRFATRSRRDDLLAVDGELIRAKARDARANPRRREIHVLHSGDDDPLQRMLNAVQPGSYVTPHRHLAPPKAEAFVLLAGSLGVVVFDDAGESPPGGMVRLARSAGSLAVDLEPGAWHTFFALEPDTVLFEVKAGPYDPAGDKEFAPWAPREDEPGATRYLGELEDRFRRRLGLGPRPWGDEGG